MACASAQDSVWVPQYQSPPASPGAGTSPDVVSHIIKLLSKFSLKFIDIYTGWGAYQRIWFRGNQAKSNLDQYNFPAV